MDPGDAGLFEGADGSSRVDGVAVSRVRIDNDGNVDGLRDVARVVDHLLHSDEPHIRIATHHRNAGARHDAEWKANFLHDFRAQGVMGAPAHEQPRPCKPVPKPLGPFHGSTPNLRALRRRRDVY
jgi:hypothetical protein